MSDHVRELGNGIVELSADFIVYMDSLGRKKPAEPKPKKVSGPVLVGKRQRKRKSA